MIALDKDTVAKGVGVARAQIGLARETIRTMDATIAGLQTMCPHDWSHKGTGRHGSDKGDDYYECRICGAEKTE